MPGPQENIRIHAITLLLLVPSSVANLWNIKWQNSFLVRFFSFAVLFLSSQRFLSLIEIFYPAPATNRPHCGYGVQRAHKLLHCGPGQSQIIPNSILNFELKIVPVIIVVQLSCWVFSMRKKVAKLDQWNSWWPSRRQVCRWQCATKNA